MKKIERLDICHLNGVITAYLSMCLLIISSLIFSVMASARDKGMRMRCEMAMDMGLQSVFAEYNRELLKKFDLYFIDSSYGTKSGNELNTLEHLKDYMSYNLSPSKGQIVFNSRDFYGLKISNAKINVFSLATDSNARVFKRQAIHYVKDKYGISIINDVMNSKKEFEGYRISEYDANAEREKYKDAIDKCEKKAKKEEKDFKNPVKDIEKERGGILKFLLGRGSVSGKEIDKSNLVSERSLKSGDGIIANTENLDSMTNNFLFDAYIADKMSNYIDGKNNGGMAYEQEYILKGNNSDEKNLTQTVNQLLITREAANSIYIMGDSEKKGQIEPIVEAICTFLGVPELAEPLTMLMLLAWAFAEACVDVRTLLDKGKVPIMKDSSTWILDTWTKAINFKAHINDGKKVNTGLNYSLYLRLFYTFENKDKKLMRCLDMIENDIRTTSGNGNFNMDSCIEYIEAEVNIYSSFKFSYVVKRYFGYEAMPKISY